MGYFFFIQLKKMICEIKEKCDKMRVEIEKDRNFRKGEQMTEKEKMIAGMIY